MGTQIALALSLSVLLNGSSTAQKLAHKVATIILEYVISSADNYVRCTSCRRNLRVLVVPRRNLHVPHTSMTWLTPIPTSHVFGMVYTMKRHCVSHLRRLFMGNVAAHIRVHGLSKLYWNLLRSNLRISRCTALRASLGFKYGPLTHL